MLTVQLPVLAATLFVFDAEIEDARAGRDQGRSPDFEGRLVADTGDQGEAGERGRGEGFPG